ncbi:MAG: DUF4129 domain-containing protein [Bacteroidetes bacterium]|nr:DUF4129 domain-containing protein [Bacteroidota bacterium]
MMQADSMQADVPISWLDSLRASGQYDFHQGQAHLDPWEWFKRLLAELFGSAVTSDGGITVVNVLFYALVLAALVAGIYWFRKGGAENPSGRSSRHLDHGSITEENLYEIDFDRSIGEAVAASDLRLAVRYLYLQSLRHLEQHAWIVIRSGKTNRDYEREVSMNAVGNVFRTARLEYEQVWYGKHDIDAMAYDRIRAVFTELQIKARRA